MNINDIYSSDSQYLKAEHLPKDKEILVKIESWDMVELDGKKKVCLKFMGKDRVLVLNKTNAMAISTPYGPDPDMWQGREIFMYSTKVDYAGQMVDAIRVRAKLETAMDDEDIPF